MKLNWVQAHDTLNQAEEKIVKSYGKNLKLTDGVTIVERNGISCYRASFDLSDEILNSDGNLLQVDFGYQYHIIKIEFYINYKLVSKTYSSEEYVRFLIPKKEFKSGENHLFVVITEGAEMGIRGVLTTDDAYVSEIASLPEEIVVSVPNALPSVTDVKNDGDFAEFKLSNGTSARLNFYENAVFRLKYPADAKQLADEYCLQMTLKSDKTVVIEQNSDFVSYKAGKNTLIVYLNPFKIEVLDKDGKPLFVQNDEPMACDELGGISVKLENDEHIFGINENGHPHLDKRGTIEDIWVRHDFWRCDVYCPFYISTKGYGLYLNSAFHSIFDMGYSIPDAALLYTYSNIIDLFFIDGPAPQDIISSFTGIIGRSPMPPKWAFGFWQAGFNICKSRENATYALNRYNEENIPVDVFCFDPAYAKNRSDLIWSDETFPNHKEYLKLIDDNDMHQILWICPFAVPDSEIINIGKKNGMFMVDKDGNFLRSHNWVGKGSGLLDFDSPTTKEWLTNGLSSFLNEGVAGFKLDGGDTFEVPERMFTNAGISAKEMHNVYPIMHAKAVQTIAKQTKPDERPVTWQRTGFTGSGRYPITWGGDQLATFGGMQVLIKGGQGAGLCGVSFWSQDIGGFSWHPETDEELFIRSYQWGVLSPLARAHGRKTEPWAWTERGLKITGDFIKLRYKLLPYIYSCAYTSHKTGVPFMYPLFFFAPTDQNTYSADYQYGYGPAFMIAPIYEKAGNEEGTATREIYLPEGEWIDFNTKEIYKGGKHIPYTATIDVLPLFIKKGAIIPQVNEVARVAKLDFSRLTVEIYPDSKETSFDWYNDEGNNFDYQKDINNIISFKAVNDGAIKIDIAAKNAKYQPDYAGEFTLKVFCDKPNTVTVNGKAAEFTYDDFFAEIKVKYDIKENLSIIIK